MRATSIWFNPKLVMAQVMLFQFDADSFSRDRLNCFRVCLRLILGSCNLKNIALKYLVN